jgi:hypothetical protein
MAMAIAWAVRMAEAGRGGKGQMEFGSLEK